MPVAKTQSIATFAEVNNVAHAITIRPDGKHDTDKFLTACTCGTEGRFPTMEEAKQYAELHRSNYRLPVDSIKVLDTPYVVPGLSPQPAMAGKVGEPKSGAPPAPPPYKPGGAAQMTPAPSQVKKAN
jgi:hypothetical protein